MSDDLAIQGHQDGLQIDVNEACEVQYWSDKFGVSSDRLRQVVKEAGNGAASVEEFLMKRAVGMRCFHSI